VWRWPISQLVTARSQPAFIEWMGDARASSTSARPHQFPVKESKSGWHMQERQTSLPVEQRRDILEETSRLQSMISALKRWLLAAWPVLVILALPVLLLSHSLFGGGATITGDILLQGPPWSVELPHSGLPQNPALFDDVFDISPWMLFLRQQLLAGHLPLWDSYVAGGTPFLAADQPGVFYPLNWIAALLPYPFGMTVMTLLKWWVVGLGMYVFGHVSLRLGQASALVAALSFMFSSFIVVWLIHTVGQAAMLLPWAMWATERAIRAPSARRVVVLAVIVALVGFSGHPEMSFHVMLGAGLYALWLAALPRSLSWLARARLLTRWAGGVLLGIGLAAIQYVPTLALLPQTLASQLRGPQYGAIQVPLQGLLTWLVPNIWGTPAQIDNYWGPRNYNEEVWYAGVVALVLAFAALLALRRRERRGEIAFFALLAVVFAGLLYRIPPFVWLSRLPILDRDSWTRLGLLAILGVSALAGFGFEEMLAWGKTALAPGPENENAGAAWRRVWHRANRRVLAALLGLVALLPLLLWAVGRFYHPPHLEAAQLQWVVPWIRLAVFLLWATGALLLLRWQGWLSGRVVGGLLLGLILCDQLLFAAPYTPQPSASVAYPETPTMARLQQTVGTARMAAASTLIGPDSGLPYGLHDLRAYEITASSRYLHYMLVMDPGLGQTNAFCCQFLDCPSPTLLGVASVEYYATLPDFDPNRCKTLNSGQSAASGPFAPLWTQGGITLWRNTLARPRFYFAAQVTPSGGEAQTLALLPALRPGGRDAIIEGAAPLPDSASAGQGTITVLTDQPGEITLHTQTTTGQWLIVDEGYDSGWQGDVDGASEPLHPANEMFQAIFVPAGAHTIHLLYRPASFLLGMAVSALALLILLGLLLGDWARRRFQLSLPFGRDRRHQGVSK
jgi:hypothetical protein